MQSPSHDNFFNTIMKYEFFKMIGVMRSRNMLASNDRYSTCIRAESYKADQRCNGCNLLEKIVFLGIL